MTALSADFKREMAAGPLSVPFPVKTATAIWDRAALCLEDANGFARPVAAGLTNPEFLGFAMHAVATSTDSSGTYYVEINQEGYVVAPSGDVSGVSAVTDVGKTIYMTDDGNGFTTLSTGNVPIGKVAAVDATQSKVWIHYQAHALRSI